MKLFRSHLTRLGDEDLVDLVRGGDAAAFEVLYDRHAGPAYSLAFRIVGERVMAEEVLQDAFLAVWRNAERYKAGRGSVRTWLLGITHHRAVDHIRRNTVHARRRATGDGLDERVEAPERTDAEAARREEAREVQSALRELPVDQVRVLELAYFGGFTHTEIAELLETPLGTVKSRMRRGLESLGGRLAMLEQAS